MVDGSTTGTDVLTREDREALLGAFSWPSESYWRSFELQALRGLVPRRPMLEIGCGDGGFTEILGWHVEEAIDLNPRAVAVAERRTGTYGRVRCADARSVLAHERGAYGTVFANSVLEHIDGVEPVLRAAHDLLEPGGSFISTVPVRAMNEHLLLRSPRYAHVRQRLLEHRNLWSTAEWDDRLADAGFEHVRWEPFLAADDCRRWDAIDAPAAVGIGRYRVAPILRRAARLVVPAPTRGHIAARGATWWQDHKGARAAPAEPACGYLFVATRS